MYQIKKLETASVGKLGSIICGLLFFFWGALGAASFLSIDQWVVDLHAYKIPVRSLSLAWLLINMAIGIIGGFVLGAAVSIVYNGLARLVGGLRLDIVQVAVSPPSVTKTAEKNQSETQSEQPKIQKSENSNYESSQEKIDGQTK